MGVNRITKAFVRDHCYKLYCDDRLFDTLTDPLENNPIVIDSEKLSRIKEHLKKDLKQYLFKQPEKHNTKFIY